MARVDSIGGEDAMLASPYYLLICLCGGRVAHVAKSLAVQRWLQDMGVAHLLQRRSRSDLLEGERVCCLCGMVTVVCLRGAWVRRFGKVIAIWIGLLRTETM